MKTFSKEIYPTKANNPEHTDLIDAYNIGHSANDQAASKS
jgi:hypothetical protein